MISYSNRCKEANPIKTIQKAENILLDLGMLTTSTWFSPTENLYSVHLKVVGTSIYTNGKGSSEEFALASAYGEMMERIQNLVSYRFSHYLDYYTSNLPYKIDKKERMTTTVDELDTQKKYFNMVLSKEAYAKCIDAWNHLFNGRPVLNATFVNIFDTSDIINLPELVYDVYYGSNGMASGNTYAEAFVQGMSEICERYAIRRIIKEKLTPPDITEEVLSKYPAIQKLVQSIEEQNNSIRIRIKDINLGIGLPVFAAIYIDSSSQKYFANFGCHPNVAVGVERCITELYQGQSNVKVNNATSINQEYQNETANMQSIFVTGEGVYPIEFFGKNASYKKLVFENLAFESNMDMCKFYLNLVSKLNYKIYYQDVGFLGFPAISLLIPGMSEAIFDQNDADVICILEHDTHFLENYQSLYSLNTDELIKMIEFIKCKQIDASISVNDILKVPVREPHNHFNDITLDLFLAMLYIRLSNYKEAKKYLDRFIKYMKSDNADTFSIEYNTLISAILSCKTYNLNDDEITDLLSEHFPSQDVRSCISDIRPENVFDGLPQCICPNCNACEYENFCNFKRDNDFANKLLQIKFAYTESMPLVKLLE